MFAIATAAGWQVRFCAALKCWGNQPEAEDGEQQIGSETDHGSAYLNSHVAMEFARLSTFSLSSSSRGTFASVKKSVSTAEARLQVALGNCIGLPRTPKAQLLTAPQKRITSLSCRVGGGSVVALPIQAVGHRHGLTLCLDNEHEIHGQPFLSIRAQFS